LCEKALSNALEINHLSTLAGAEFAYGGFFMIKGDGASAVKHYQEAIRYAEESQTVYILGVSWAMLGYAYCLMGQFRTGLDLAEKGLRIHQDHGLHFYLTSCHLCCGLAHFELGELEEAQTHFELGLQSALQNQERFWQAIIRSYLGWVMIRKDPTQIESAEEYIRQGITQVQGLGLRAYYPLGYMILGAVYAESSRPEEALRPLKKAEVMFEEMGMEYYLGRTQKILERVG
jgi:tetratricopeptide (TPR) repeat protein